MEQEEQLKPLNISVDHVGSSRRIEHKSIMGRDELPNFLSGITNNGGEVLYASRTITSTYFDTENFDAHYQSEEGLTPRHKVRIRSYPNTTPERYQVELKSTLAYGRSKVSRTLEKDHINRALNGGICLNNRHLISAITIKYWRSYFQIGHERITLDQCIKFVGHHRLSGLSAHLDDFLVVEVKTKDDRRGLDVLSSLNLPLRRFSKYCAGIRLLTRNEHSSLQ